MNSTEDVIFERLVQLMDRLQVAQLQAFWALVVVSMLLLVFFAGAVTEAAIYATCLIFCGLRYTFATMKASRVSREIDQFCEQYNID